MSEQRRRVSIAGNERVFLCGKTGSGKSYAAMHLLAPIARLVCIDLKGSDTIAGLPWDREDGQAMRRLAAGHPVRVRVRDYDAALTYMELAYQSGGCIVYIDEVLMLCPQGARPPKALEAIWTRGRELGVGGWAATQRPVWVPLWLISEAEWTFCFKLRLAEDRARMAAYMGEEVEETISDEHGFWVNKDWDDPQYYASINGRLALERESEVSHA